MAADVFETYAVSLIGAILVAALTLKGNSAAIAYPFLVGGISIIGSIAGIVFVNRSPLKPGAALMAGVGVAAAMSAVLLLPITYLLFGDGIDIGAAHYGCGSLYFATLVGLAMTGIVVLITNYYTSTAYSPVRKIAKASETGHATNIIAGLATGQHATALPITLLRWRFLFRITAEIFTGLQLQS